MFRVLLLLSSILILNYFNGRSKINDRPFVYLAPPEFLKEVHLGYSESVADSLWIRYIQDIEACGDKPTNSVQAQEQCNNGWAFRILDSITTLAPKFRMPYAVGGTNLSILSKDNDGAKIIFDRSIERFDQDWPILYRAAYFYLYEVEDQTKAAALLDRAVSLGAPNWVSSLASRIWTKTGQLELGIRSLEEYKKSLFDPKQKKDIQKRIDQLVAEYKKSTSK